MAAERPPFGPWALGVCFVLLATGATRTSATVLGPTSISGPTALESVAYLGKLSMPAVSRQIVLYKSYNSTTGREEDRELRMLVADGTSGARIYDVSRGYIENADVGGASGGVASPRFVASPFQVYPFQVYRRFICASSGGVWMRALCIKHMGD